MLHIHLCNYSSQQVDSFVLSSQVAVEDGGFASEVLKNRPVMINFRINKPSNVRDIIVLVLYI